MARPTKNEIEGNPDFLRDWAEFQRDHPGGGPILLPVSVDMSGGIIVRDRIKSGDVADLREGLLQEFDEKFPGETGGDYTLDGFRRVMDDYIEWFEGDDKQNPLRPSPLDFRITRPVWILFHVKNPHWAFSKNVQFSVENDGQNDKKNCVKICTLDNNNMFLMENRWRMVPLLMKYNLHVTITQTEAGRELYTDLIIDPGMNNQFPP